MNTFLKNSSVFLIFTLLLANVYAIQIESVKSDATEKGVLGIGDTISFEVNLFEPVDGAFIDAISYNTEKLEWKTEDNHLFLATYTVKDGHPDLKKPQQLEDVVVCNLEGECSEKVSGEDIYKTIDATVPELTNVIINKINKTNYTNYTIEADLKNSEDTGVVTYIITDKLAEEVKGEINLEDILISETRLLINDLNLSSLADGDIKIELEIIDAGLNKYNFEQNTIKISVVPEILKTDLININKITADNYSFDMIITGDLKNAKVVGVLKDTVGNSLSFEQVISELSSTEEYTFSDVDVSILKDGIVNLEIHVVDSAGNSSKIIEEIIHKDVIVPEIVLEKNEVYSNTSSLTLKGTVIDRLNERIKVTYVRDDFEGDCVVQYSPSDTAGYNYVTCNIELKEDGVKKIIVRTKDSSGNFSEKRVTVYVNTSKVDLKIDGDLRIVTKDASSITNITGKYQLSTDSTDDSKYFAILKKQNTSGFKKFDLILKDDNAFIVYLNEDSVSGNQLVYPLTDGVYTVTVYLSDIFGNSVTASKNIIIDSVSPIVEINNTETTNRSPELSGKVIDDLNTTVEVVINDVTYNAIVDGQNWSVQITETLPLGSQSVRVIAKDEALNETEETKENALTINSTGGGGTIIYPTTSVAAVPVQTSVETSTTTPAFVEPTPVENQPQGETNTGGEVITPQEEIEPVEETPELVETPVETPTPSGLTGFAGFASSPGGVVTIVGSVLLVIGAVGYFFFLRPR